MDRIIKIATRGSDLALWQANRVKELLAQLSIDSELIIITTKGDSDQNTPLNKLGSYGVFTKSVDKAVIEEKCDIAVHSLKDLPTQLDEKLVLAAVIERGASEDVLVFKGDKLDLNKTNFTIATGSIRRTALWLNKFPSHKVVGLRGNVNTRLDKLDNSDWDAAIFAKAGLERIGLLPKKHLVLDWMVSAPAQGSIGLTAKKEDSELLDLLKNINHINSNIEVSVERSFMRSLEGGCSIPLGAYAKISNNTINFEGIIVSPDGSEKVELKEHGNIKEWESFGTLCADKIKTIGADKLRMKIIDSEGK